MTDSRKPSFEFWASILVVSVPLLYVLMFPVACWLVDRGTLPVLETARVYRPLLRGATYEFRPIGTPFRWYAELLLDGSHWGKDNTTVVTFMDLVLEVYDAVGERPSGRFEAAE